MIIKTEYMRTTEQRKKYMNILIAAMKACSVLYMQCCRLIKLKQNWVKEQQYNDEIDVAMVRMDARILYTR